MSDNTADHLRVIEGEGGRAPSVPPDDPLVGRTIDGRYLIERVLGEGGMGLVYQAKHAVLNKRLAIKVLRPEVSKDEEIITRFRQEAQSASSIGNQHIIDISDFGTLPDGSTYFVMEYLEGQDLTAAIDEQRPMADQRVVHIAKQLCQALGAAHQRGIVHRDLKPDNIFLIRRGGDSSFVKVLDFGIAKVGGGTKRLTKAGQVFGTPHYMSPEQCAGTGTDHRTDIYAVGVMLYEMTAGRVPFDADNLMGILTKHMYEQPIPPHTLPPPVEVSPALEAIILRCLEKSADARYQSMEEVFDDLVKVEQGLTPDAVVHAMERGSQTGSHEVGREPTGTGLRMRVGEPAQTQDVPAKRSLVPILGAVGGLLVVGAIVAVVLASGDEPETTEPVEPEAPTVAEAPVAEVEGVAEQNVEQSGGTETEMVTLSTEPEGVEVWLGEELIGNAPAELPRPEGEERLEITLRKAGYRSQDVRISSLTAESVRITLEQEPQVEEEEERPRVRRPARRRPARMRATSTEEAPAMTEPAPTMELPRRPTLPQSEVIDPWG